MKITKVFNVLGHANFKNSQCNPFDYLVRGLTGKDALINAERLLGSELSELDATVSFAGTLAEADDAKMCRGPMVMQAQQAFEALQSAAKSNELIPEHSTAVKEAVRVLSEVFPLPG